MKKFKLLSIIVVGIFLVFLIIIKFSEKPEDVLQKHLKNRYNKEFVIYYGGNRSDGRSKWFEAEIYPKELVGTIREYDKYYWAKGFVENGKGGDTYGGVLLNESANEFYLPKLKELFGENVLPILNIEGYYEKTDFQEEIARRREFYKEDPDGKFFPISGGIYIFGRVENDEDREKYREEIYKFLSFMKETGTFEYVKLDFSIIDERIITDEFTAKNLQQEILKIYEKALNNEITGEEFKEKRKKLLSEIKVPYKLNKNKLDEWNKGNIISIDDKLGMASTILFSKIISEKFIASNEYFYKEYPKKSYDKIEDIKLDY